MPIADTDQFEHYKILVMDDEEMVRRVTNSMFSRLGHEVCCAENGEEALDLYQKELKSETPFDFVIMDLTIPDGMSGKETVRKLLTINAEAKVIVSSGYSNDPIMANYQNFGFCAAIAKPYRLQDLKKTINSLAKKRP